MFEAGRTCTRCATWYPPYLVEHAFQRRRGVDISSPHSRGQLLKGVCRPCEQTARDTRKQDDRWKVKARDVIRRHAERLKVSKEDLIGRYGWDPAVIAHQAEYAYGNGCGYCGHKYMEMDHGFWDITLDIVDRSKPPNYRTNTKWCCATCNRKKGVMTPEAFELDRQVYESWNATDHATPEDRGLLFDL